MVGNEGGGEGGAEGGNENGGGQAGEGQGGNSDKDLHREEEQGKQPPRAQ